MTLKQLKPVAIAVILVILYFGWRWGYHRLFLFDTYKLDGTTQSITAVAEGVPEASRYGYSLEARINGAKAIVYFSGTRTDIRIGDEISGLMKITAGYENGRHLKAAMGGSPTVTRPDKLKLRYFPLVWASKISEAVSDIYEGDEAAIIDGILTGKKSDFSQNLKSDLSATGMSHVASVSGLHVSTLAGFILLLVRSRKVAVFVLLPLLFGFVAIAGFTPSALRAFIMYAMFLLAPLIFREYNGLQALTVAFVVLAFVNPYCVQDVGMQLSFASALGIVLFSSKLNRYFLSKLKKNFVTKFLSSALASTLSALVFSTPIMALHFGSFSIISPLTNMLLLWIVSLVFILAPFTLVLSLVWLPLGTLLAYAVKLLLTVFLQAMDIAARLPMSVLYVDEPLVLGWLLFAYCMIVTAFVFKVWKLQAALAIGTLPIIIVLLIFVKNSSGVEITVLNVGQGQCVVIRSEGQTAVVDCGGNYLDAGNIAADYLSSVGEKNLDYLLLTHAHSDHVNGVTTLLSRVETAKTILPQFSKDEVTDFSSEFLIENTALTLGKATLHLVPSQWIESTNEQCMAVICTYKDFSFAITGDLSGSSERWLLRVADFMKNGVLVAGHHGSAYATSDEWLDVLSPQTAIISVGTNTFGHPSQSVLERLNARNIEVYQTIESGSIVIKAQ